MRQPQQAESLPIPPLEAGRMRVVPVTALESDFPAVWVSRGAERESWRKEVHRPASHTHKWWAQRLGSVFRGIIASAATPSASDALSLMSGPPGTSQMVVLDPFAGSGTTLVEAIKLGCRAVGYDINPVAALVQRQAVSTWDPGRLQAAYDEVQRRARLTIDELHRNVHGETVLYYFWVATTSCPECPPRADKVELFSRYVFAQHAYAKKYPTAQATCPRCHAVNRIDLSIESGLDCHTCGWQGSLDGPVKGQYMTCAQGHRSKILAALGGEPPEHRMYAKMVLGADGKKRYDPIDEFDLELYARAEKRLIDEGDVLVRPVGSLAPGYNTRQAMSWGYRSWDQFFNARQLLSLGVLGAAVRDLPESAEREGLVALFSGVLEFNNLFCSFKGEGTGAVRHMFSHHVLKPERTPLEAHPWGTPQSSGSFSTLFKSRILRALEYKQKPHDFVDEDRIAGVSHPLHADIVQSGSEFNSVAGSAFIIAGNSARIDMADSSVDLVVTDPPYFDNVHYSELADFFHAWLRGLKPFPGYAHDESTTRQKGEVQSTDAAEFSSAIQAVWSECARVLKREGLLAFTFHQARVEGWVALVEALRESGLVVTAIQPVKGEMSVAAPKSGAADPSNLDSIVVCRKVENGLRPTIESSIKQLSALADAGIAVGWSDIQSVVRGTVMARRTFPDNVDSLEELTELAATEADRACALMGVNSRRVKA